MTTEEIKVFMNTLAHVTTDYKLEWNAQRYFICEKMFAMNGHNKEEEEILTLKMLPEEGASLRENYEGIREGYYMNKVHWISVTLDKVEDEFLKELIVKSYDYFITTLPKKMQVALK